MKKKIIFFYNDTPQKQLLKYISNYIDTKKFSFSFTNDLKKKCEIGIYAHDANKIKQINSKLSIISLAGMDQGKLFWPNFWIKENWSKFDFGILPGKNWANMWKESSWYIGARPKIAMLLTGWPKSVEKVNFKKNKRKKKTILYAPCFETDNKQMDVVESIKNTNFNLLIKHLPWDTREEIIRFKDVRNNIKLSNKLTKKILKKRVKIINSKLNIMKYYSKADLLITDESSVMYEALLYNLPSLSCSDWPMRTNNINKPRKIKLDKSVCIYTKKKDFKKKIKYCLDDLSNLNKKTNLIKKKHFSHIDNSSVNINNFLISYLENKKILFEIKPKFKKNFLKSIWIKLYHYFFR